ncbi:MAG: cytochrome c biogenesis protein CcdA [Alphaproteobacteria bacterium]
MTSEVGIVAVFVAGAISFLSPCVLPLVPGYISYIAGSATQPRGYGTFAARLPAIGLSLCFVLGFSTVFVALGASATALGQLLLAYRLELNIAGGALVILFGLFLIGLVRPGWMLRDRRFYPTFPGGRPLSAYMLGLAFAFGWTPCIGPILGAILTVGAVTATVADGIALLSVYSFGLGVPFLLTAAFTDTMARRLRALGRVGWMLQLAAGAIMILMGIAMITGDLAAFAFWLLETFPVLGEIG